MRRRQSAPHQWLIITSPTRAAVRVAIRRLPRGSGILLLDVAASRLSADLELAARQRGISLGVEARGRATRVHNNRELRKALLARTQLVLLSPIYPTLSHPEWQPLPRMRAAALARLAKRRLIALGGMDETRFNRVRELGFLGWAGISAFRT